MQRVDCSNNDVENAAGLRKSVLNVFYGFWKEVFCVLSYYYISISLYAYVVHYRLICAINCALGIVYKHFEKLHFKVYGHSLSFFLSSIVLCSWFLA